MVLKFAENQIAEWDGIKLRINNDSEILTQIIREVNIWSNNYRVVDSQFVNGIKKLCEKAKTKEFSRLDFFHKTNHFFDENILKLGQMNINDEYYRYYQVTLNNFLEIFLHN